MAQNLDIIGGAVLGLTAAWTLLNLKMVIGAGIHGLLAAKTGIVTAAQWLLNGAISANPIGATILLIGALIGGLVMAYNKSDDFRAGIQATWEVVKGFGTILKDYVIDRIKGLLSGLGSMANAIKSLFSGDFKGAWSSAKQGVMDITGVNAAKNAFESSKKLKGSFSNKYNESLTESKKKKAAEADAKASAKVTGETPTNTNNAVANDAKSIGSGSQTKNITINIDSFIKGFTPTHQSVNGMNTSELERYMTEMFLRVVRSAEMAT